MTFVKKAFAEAWKQTQEARRAANRRVLIEAKVRPAATYARVIDELFRPDAKPVENRNPHLLAMARGRECLLRVRLLCSGTETTVACHSNWSDHGKAGARKADDQYSVWGCYGCHKWLDQEHYASAAEKRRAFDQAHARQLIEWSRIVGDFSNPPKDRAAAHWALALIADGQGDHQAR